MLLFVLAVCFALLVSFVCSISEATLLSVGHARVETLAKSGSRAGLILRRFKREPDQPIAAVLVLNTIAISAGSAVAATQFEHAFSGWSEWWFIAVFTVTVLLFTEIAPKTVGVVHADHLAVPVAYVVQVMVQGLRPMLWITRWISRLVGAGQHRLTTSLEEIRLLATAGQNQGLFGALTAGIIANATRLRETPVRDVMVPRTRVAFLSGNRTTAENLDVVHRTGHSRFPFTPTGDLDKAEGVILTKELLFHLREQRDPDWQDLLVPLLVVPETATLNHLLRAFQREQRHLAFVVDEYGGIVGICTLEDVLEEIVGEIQDELDSRETHIVARPDGSLLCRGLAATTQVFERLGIAAVETDSQTLSGFLAEQLGSVPHAGAAVDCGGFRFLVTKANNRRAERIRVTPLPEPLPDPNAAR